MNSNIKNFTMNNKDDKIPAHLTNAIVPSLLFLLIAGGLIFFEQSLAKRKTAPLLIRVGASNSEQEEGEQQEDVFQEGKVLSNQSIKQTIRLDNSPESKALAGQLALSYLNGELALTDILRLPPFSARIDSAGDYSLIVHMIQNLLARKNYKKALPLFKLLNSDLLENYDLLFEYARTLSKTQHTDLAITQYQHILTHRPSHQSTSINLGLLLNQQKRHQEAQELFTQAIAYTSGSRKAKAFAGLADAAVGLSTLNIAIVNYKKSIEYRPAYPLTWRKLAYAQNINQSKHSIVMKSYQKALKIDPKNASLLSEYAEYLFTNMQFNTGISILRKNLTLDRGSVATRQLLILSYIQENRPLNANKQVGYLKKHSKHRYQKIIADGLSDFLEKHYQDSITLLKSSLKKERDNNLAYYMIGLAYENLSKPKNAAVYLSKIRSKHVLFNTSQYKLAQLKIKLNDTSSAIALLSNLAERLPDNHRIGYDTALLAYQDKKYELALSAINQATQQHKSKKYQLLQARIEWRSRQKENSIATLKRILVQHPRYKPAIYRLADYLEQNGQIPSALEQFKSLLEISREYSDLLYRIARIEYTAHNSLPTANLLEEYLQRKNNDIKARLLYATNFCESKYFSDCKKQIELLLKLSPGDSLSLELKQRFSVELLSKLDNGLHHLAI